MTNNECEHSRPACDDCHKEQSTFLDKAMTSSDVDGELRLHISKTMGWVGGDGKDWYPEKTDVVMQLISEEIGKQKDVKVKQYHSLCGCPMCTHHSEAYALRSRQDKNDE